MTELARVRVALGSRAYDVLVGDGAVDQLPQLIGSAVPTAQRVVVVTQAEIGIEVDCGLPSTRVLVPDGEEAKRLEVVEQLCNRFNACGLTRRDVVVAVGGGVVTDVAGFAAAVYHRGTAFVTVSTTLLGQIDAAIGGKTGVNLAEGKNLVGAFHQPAGVICDTALLSTLPPREYCSGLGELAKYHFLGGEGLDSLTLPARVAECVRLKAEVVASDETESGRRALLNYGHTLAHALEIEGQFDLRHGEAVAVGLRFAALLAQRLGRIDAQRVAEHERVLDAYELSYQLPEGCSDDRLVALMRRDKKATSAAIGTGDLTFVLDGPDGLEVLNDVSEAHVRAALADARS